MVLYALNSSTQETEASQSEFYYSQGCYTEKPRLEIN